MTRMIKLFLLSLFIIFMPMQALATGPYACRPVSRIGPQSIEGPLTLTCSTCTDAIIVPAASRLLFGTDASIQRVGSQTLQINNTLALPGNLALNGYFYNSGGGSGGSLAFNDPTRWLSTTTALLESSTAATAGTDTAFTLNAINAGAPDRILDLQVGGVSKVNISNNGSANFGDGFVLANGGFMSTGVPMMLRSAVADGATAIALKVGNYNALTTAGSKIASFYSDMFTTERAYFDYLGGLHFVTTKWDDLLVPMSTAKAAGVRAPGFEYFVKDTGGTSTGVFGYAFDSAATKELFFTAQLPHSYKEGTAIKPHVHWSPKTADTGDVKFELECTKATIDGTFAATSTITATAAAGGQLKHQLTTMTDISGTGLGISSIIMCRIARLGGDAADTYGADVFIHDVDFHYEIDSIGSTTSSAK